MHTGNTGTIGAGGGANAPGLPPAPTPPLAPAPTGTTANLPPLPPAGGGANVVVQQAQGGAMPPMPRMGNKLGSMDWRRAKAQLDRTCGSESDSTPNSNSFH